MAILINGVVFFKRIQLRAITTEYFNKNNVYIACQYINNKH